MKKTVSINIGGIIFHIEEDGYEKLKNYLDSVNKYFSTFEDNNEIIADIESRIAEIFLEKLSGGRQTVNIEDVNELIATMGTTRDFEATIENEEKTTEQKAKDSQTETEAEPTSPGPDKRLYRDTRRKLLGGVASGIAHYFQIDPLWIRLLIVVLFINVFMGGLSGATLLVYIILWIVIPPNDNLEEDKKVKKLFRNSESRVLGGVASGIASYFGTDIAVIRLIFVLSIFIGGAGILIYIILWIITPEAKSITEKMQMQGEPVTLSNIEENVKKSLNVKEGEETPLVKILLFPFRLIALVINALGKILGPLLKFLAELIRIAFGAVLVIVGFAFMVSFIAITFGFLGLAGEDNYMYFDELPVDLIRRTLETWPVISLFLVTIIPAIAIVLLGLVVILKKRVANAYVGWSLFALWVIGLMIASFSIPGLAREFTTENDIRIENTYEVTQATPTLRLNDTGHNSFDLVELRLRGHDDSVYQLIQRVTSRGRNYDNAEDNARSIIYNVEQKDGENFYFDSKISFPEDAKFRFQHVDLTFYIPYGKTFRMDEDLEEILVNAHYLNGYRRHQMSGNDWVFERDGIKCLTCKPGGNFSRKKDGRLNRSAYEGMDEIDYPFENFDKVKIASFFDVEIKKGDTYSVMVRGDDDDLDEVNLNQVGDRIEVNFRNDNWKWWSDKGSDKVGVFITMPELEHLELVGDCDGEVYGFDNEKLLFELTGAPDLYVNVSPREFKLKLTGAGKVELRGSSEIFNVDLTGASEIKAFDFNSTRVEVNAVGASKAEVYGSEELDLSAAGVSKIFYRGNGQVIQNVSGISTIKSD